MDGILWILKTVWTFGWIMFALLLIICGLLIIGVTVLDWIEERKFIQIERKD
jgi:hypothetical protein